jgi:small subunit ribosomal protein S6
MTVLTPKDEDNRVYELTILYPYPLSQKEESDLLKSVDALFAEFGAEKLHEDKWGRRGLAYPIKGFNEGSYVVYYLELDPSKLKAMETQMRILPGLLRHLAVKPPKDYQVSDFSSSFEIWKKQSAEEGDKAKAAEEQRLQKRVAEKAKRQVKRAAKKKDEVKQEAGHVEKKELDAKLDELISDDDLSL